MRFYNHHRTIIISDIPLGASPEAFKKLIFFIKNSSCNKMIFCGELAKGLQLPAYYASSHLYKEFINTLITISKRDNTEIIFVTSFDISSSETTNPLKISNISFVSQYTFCSGGDTLHVIPGDISTINGKELFKLLPIDHLRYNLLLWLNKKYNLHRLRKGKKYESLIKRFKFRFQGAKKIYELMSDLNPELIELANRKELNGWKCQGIISGHALYSGIYNFGKITLFSSGNWTESLTALVENNFGKWDVLSFENLLQEKKRDG